MDGRGVGPALICVWQAEWNILPEEQAKVRAFQRVSILIMTDGDVKDLTTMESVSHNEIQWP